MAVGVHPGLAAVVAEPGGVYGRAGIDMNIKRLGCHERRSIVLMRGIRGSDLTLI
jgi:hypothetical protein